MKALLVITLMLGGCATAVPRWVKVGATTADFETDKLLCEFEAKKATASGGDFGMRTEIGAGIAEAFKQVELMSLCLRTKGWEQQRQTG